MQGGDADQDAMPVAADPHAVLEAIKETEAAPLASEIVATPGPEPDPLAIDHVRSGNGGEPPPVEVAGPGGAPAER